jgi:hypothetical protein
MFCRGELDPGTPTIGQRDRSEEHSGRLKVYSRPDTSAVEVACGERGADCAMRQTAGVFDPWWCQDIHRNGNHR